MNIEYKGESLDLRTGFSLDIEETSPIFNDEGSQSVSTSVPNTYHNRRTLGFPGRLDTAVDPNSDEGNRAVVTDGTFRRSGVLNVTGVSTSEGISFSIGFDNSTAYQAWIGRKLCELSGLNKITSTPAILAETIRTYYADGMPWSELAVFPVALSKSVKDEDSVSSKTYWELLNVPASDGSMTQPRKLMRLIDGTATEVSVPEGYGLSPFLKVWRVLELIFSDLGVTLRENPFRDRVDLARLTVLNNTADAICSGILDYSELMPDCTVEEFLEALWVRFGLVYHIDSERGEATLRLLSDILDSLPQTINLGELRSSDRLDITYLAPQYVRLSASTSIDGASPACDRFEDYVKGISLLDLHIGPDVGRWVATGSGDSWDGEFDDTPDYEPEYPDGRDPDDIPDPWDDYDRDFWEDDRDDGRSLVAAGTRSGSYSPVGQPTWLGRETVTGRWWVLDRANNLKKDSSSGFFNWDPAPEAISAFDLTSPDDCVPVERINIGSTGAANPFNGYAPAYLVGARHRHSYVKGNDSDDEETVETPLAFMWAYNTPAGTIGRLAPEAPDGKEIELEDGGDQGTTLYFQFADGLFSRYWKKYDEILRHGCRSVEIDVRLKKWQLQQLDILRPVVVGGCLCLIDKLEYTLPSGPDIPVSLTLRTISTLGTYDIDQEQGIPAVAMTGVGLAWAWYEGDWQAAEDAKRPQLDQQAYLKFKTMLAYREVWGDGTDIFVDPMGVSNTGSWVEEMPRTLPATIPTAPAGTYRLETFRGRIYYSCRMVKRVHDPETGALISKEVVGDVVGYTFVDYTFDAVYISAYVVKR